MICFPQPLNGITLDLTVCRMGKVPHYLIIYSPYTIKYNKCALKAKFQSNFASFNWN